ncbi:MAG: hypothetical protein ABI076_10335, partial [Acidobacteriaceae bacterium]
IIPSCGAGKGCADAGLSLAAIREELFSKVQAAPTCSQEPLLCHDSTGRIGTIDTSDSPSSPLLVASE